MLDVTQQLQPQRLKRVMSRPRFAAHVALITAAVAIAGMAHAAILGVQFNGSVWSINETTAVPTLLSNNPTFSANAMTRTSTGTYYVAGGLGTSTLNTVNPTTGVLTAGPVITPNDDVRGLAASPTDVIYATAATGGGAGANLYTINPGTGVGTLIAAVGPMQGLTFSTAGTLYGWSNTLGLVTIDPTTGAVTDVNPAIGSTDNIQTLAFSPGGVLYAGAQPTLYTVDTSTGALTLVGSIAPMNDLRGMEFLSGGPPAPGVSLTPSPLGFGNQVVATTSPPQVLTLQNVGTATLNIASIAASGDFAQTNTCAATLAPAASCTISVTFTPTALGARAGAITVNSDAASSPNTVPLSGTGVAAPPVATALLSPPAIAFGNQLVGTTSAAQTLTLQNVGGTDLTIASIVASGDFAQTNTCPATLGPTASCTISVTFTPTVLGARNGAITVTSNGVGSPNVSTLSGTGAAVPPPATPGQAIPTLSQWALIGLCVLLGLLTVVIRRAPPRRR